MQDNNPKPLSFISKIWGAIKAALATVWGKMSAIFDKLWGRKKSIAPPEQKQEQRTSSIEQPKESDTAVPPKQELPKEQARQPSVLVAAPIEQSVGDDLTRKRQEWHEALKAKALVSIKKANEWLSNNQWLRNPQERSIEHMEQQKTILEAYCEREFYDMNAYDDAKSILTQLDENCTTLENKAKAALENFPKKMAGEPVPIDPNSELGKSIASAKQNLENQREAQIAPPKTVEQPVGDYLTRKRQEWHEALKVKALVSIKKANEWLSNNQWLRTSQDRSIIDHMEQQKTILEAYCKQEFYDMDAYGDAKYILTQLDENCTTLENKAKAAWENFHKKMAGEPVESVRMDPKSELGKSMASAKQNLENQREAQIEPPKTVEQSVTLKTLEEERIEKFKALVKEVDKELGALVGWVHDQKKGGLGSLLTDQSYESRSATKEKILEDIKGKDSNPQLGWRSPIDNLQAIIKNNGNLIPVILSSTIEEHLKDHFKTFIEQLQSFKKQPIGGLRLTISYTSARIRANVNIIKLLIDATLAVNRAKEIMSKSPQPDMVEQTSNVESAIKAVFNETAFDQILTNKFPTLEVAYQALEKSITEINIIEAVEKANLMLEYAKKIPDNLKPRFFPNTASVLEETKTALCNETVFETKKTKLATLEYLCKSLDEMVEKIKEENQDKFKLK